MRLRQIFFPTDKPVTAMSQNKVGEISATATDKMTEQALLPTDCGAQMMAVSNTFIT